MKTILIVDDDTNLRELLNIRLNSNGYSVMEASNGIGAFAQIKDRQPDVIILDADMPVMDGYQFTQEIRWHADWKDIPLIVLTGKVRTKELFQAMNGVRFLTKPFNSQELLGEIKSCLDE